MKRAIILVTLLSLSLPLGVARADSGLTVGDVEFHESRGFFQLANPRVDRAWATHNGVLTDGSLHEGRTKPWILPDLPEFSVTLDGITLDARNFELTNVSPIALSNGIRVSFRYEIGARTELPMHPDNLSMFVGLSVDRTVTLFEGSSIFEISNTLHNNTPLPLRLNAFRLDEIFADNIGPSVQIDSYVGGSDWRDDFRTTTTVSTAASCAQTIPGVPGPSTCAPSIDREGEMLRTDDGTGHGWFHVAERRGGAASRAGVQFFDTEGKLETTWVGADFGRDIVDLGPLATSPPNYNRVENPAYPAPVTARLVLPLSSMDLGTVATGVYHGGAQNAAVAYADYLATYRQPQYRRAVALNSFHPWSHGADFNDATMRKQADVAKELGIDTIVLDDQWQGGPGGESGDWQWDTSDTDGDPARFPDSNHDGVADIVDYFHSQGIKLGLWMSPVEFNANSQTFKDHPNWACTPIGTVTGQAPDDAGLGVWDINNQEFRAYITGVVDRLIKDDDVHYFKFDFQTWVDCPPYDYNDYEAGFASWVDEIEVKHPDVAFEFDETNDQRMWAFESVARGPAWFDNAHGHTTADGAKVTGPAQLLHDIWMASPWIPPSTIGAGTFDGTLSKGYDASFLLPISCLTYWTFWTDLTKLSPEVRAETTWWVDWYHTHSDALRGGAYELTDTDPMDGTAPAAFEIGGYVFAFRQAGDAPIIALHQEGSFTLTNVRDGSVLGTFAGGDAITVPLANPNSAAVYQITAV